jgi:hypothetical protein
MFVAMKNFLFLFACTCFLFPALGQKAPLPVEVMAGNNRANLLIIINRPIDAAGKFNFFNVTRVYWQLKQALPSRTCRKGPI